MAEMGHWFTARNKRHRMHFLMWKWRRLTVNIIIMQGLYWLTVNCLWHCILFYFNCILFNDIFKKSKTIQLSDLNWTLHGFSKNILILAKMKNILRFLIKPCMVDFVKQINPFNTCTVIFMKEMLALRISLRQFSRVQKCRKYDRTYQW